MTASSKIIFINRFFYPDHSATSQLLGDLAFDLARNGASVEVITSRLRYDDAGARLPLLETIDGVIVRRAWSSRFGRQTLAGRVLDYATFYLGAAIQLWRECGPRAIVVAKTDPPLISIVAAPIAKLRGAKLVNWLQDLFPEVAGALGVRIVRGPVLALLRVARNASLRFASANVVLGSRMEARLREEGVDAGKLRIIHNWADATAIQPVPPELNPLRHAWGLADKFVVAYSGNLGRAHEFATVMDAAKLLAHRKDIVFLFIGGGAQYGTVQSLARDHGLHNVLFRPYQPREALKESLSVADVHLVTLNPALEGLIVPSKFYGIAAAGRPTLFVGAADGEIAGILEHSACGYSIVPGNGAELARKIEMLADQPGLAQQLGGNARRKFLESYSREKAINAWRSVLELHQHS